MEITDFIFKHRETLQIADYNAYRAQLSRQILAARKRLGRTTNRKEKFAPKAITVEDVGKNPEFVHLALLMSERAWAHAMYIKISHTEDSAARGLTGSTRSHLISRLSKAVKTARELLVSIGDEEVTKTSDRDVLECRAYVATLAGAEEFEKQSGGLKTVEGQSSEQRWQACLGHYSEARVIYAAFYERDKREIYKEILANTIDPTIRYAAYQAHLSRTIAISTIAKRYFPKDDAKLVKLVEAIDPYALKDKPKIEAEKQASPQDVPNSVTWRGRRANIVDASIGQALAAVTTAEARLRSYLTSNSEASNREKAAAYDEILVASQDAADATKRATDELEKERVDEGDPRMQDLRVTSLAVNYDLVSWRVGRNRVLIGSDDGMKFETQKQKVPQRLRKDGTAYAGKDEGRGHKLARLRERNVLFDATIQSIDSVKNLPGAMRDSSFVEELAGKTSYFRALKCLNIAYSHTLLGNPLNALALLQRAQSLSSHPSIAASETQSEAKPPTLEISTSSSQTLQKHIANLVLRTHALVEMHKLEAQNAATATKHSAFAAPLIQDLHRYPLPGTHVDLQNLVTYPPKIEPVPVKPLFLDVAWNYIDYPRGKGDAVQPMKGQGVVNGLSLIHISEPTRPY